MSVSWMKYPNTTPKLSCESSIPSSHCKTHFVVPRLLSLKTSLLQFRTTVGLQWVQTFIKTPFSVPQSEPKDIDGIYFFQIVSSVPFSRRQTDLLVIPRLYLLQQFGRYHSLPSSSSLGRGKNFSPSYQVRKTVRNEKGSDPQETRRRNSRERDVGVTSL